MLLLLQGYAEDRQGAVMARGRVSSKGSSDGYHQWVRLATGEELGPPGRCAGHRA